ncbi:hypothetical protein Pan14r_03420 [Crateriforma conspicua]|uniref:Uncharacterized protein n=1 Tax=Crateriforma conspicua TaxID=2527996 RepID=A0A5C5XYY9_9PLAN|nr:hypothetical protein Pan14r_03420 [Crateriforma conspicua]
MSRTALAAVFAISATQPDAYTFSPAPPSPSNTLLSAERKATLPEPVWRAYRITRTARVTNTCGVRNPDR